MAVHDLALDAAESAVTGFPGSTKTRDQERLASLIPPDLRENPEVLRQGTDVALPACPRCGDRGIADAAASAPQVLVLEHTRARERREDAKVTDDRDERERRAFETLTLVDLDPRQPHGLRAWRNADRFFGVEFAREAVIRQINFGPDGAPGVPANPIP